MKIPSFFVIKAVADRLVLDLQTQKIEVKLPGIRNGVPDRLAECLLVRFAQQSNVYFTPEYGKVDGAVDGPRPFHRACLDRTSPCAADVHGCWFKDVHVTPDMF